MKMMITDEWLRNKIEASPETDIDAGLSLTKSDSIDGFLPSNIKSASVEDERVISLRHAFGLFIRNLRLINKLTIAELSKRASIEEAELYAIENDPHNVTKPRTIYQLSNFFKVDRNKMMLLSGSSIVNDEIFEEEALKFAAMSDGVSSLNKDEQQILNEYVKFLHGG